MAANLFIDFDTANLFDALGVPEAEVLTVGQNVDLDERIVLSPISPTDVAVAGISPEGYMVNGVVSGAMLPGVLCADIGLDRDYALRLVNAVYWLPIGNLFALPREG